MPNLFECCYKCTAPKRHHGCHATCKEYLEARAENERRKAIEDLERPVVHYNCERKDRRRARQAKATLRVNRFKSRT